MNRVLDILFCVTGTEDLADLYWKITEQDALDILNRGDICVLQRLRHRYQLRSRNQ